jgi:lipopolysaccharide/colanic/teichoic acid biosynthesis glycosyltransferase
MLQQTLPLTSEQIDWISSDSIREIPLSRSTPVVKRRRTGRPHVLSEALFRRVVIDERRQADRANHPLVLMTVSMNRVRSADASVLWREAIDIIAQQTRETDVLGWLAVQSVIGIVLHEVHAPDATYPRELEVRLRRALATRLDGDTVAAFSIRLYVHSTPRPAEPDKTPSIDPPALAEPRASATRTVVYQLIKRVFDIVGSLALLAVLAPLFLLIAALVKMKSPGPVFFRQERVGRKLKTFRMLKFRTMHVNADHRLHREFVSQFIKSGGHDQQPGASGIFKLVNDPRVTPVGSVLRRTSLDELPQLLNVLRGEMSLVGPRPPLPYEVEQYEPWHIRRVVEAKPGMTGLWQVGGRSRTTFDDMVRLDLRYARARSLRFDLKILLATPGAVFSGKGAC